MVYYEGEILIIEKRVPKCNGIKLIVIRPNWKSESRISLYAKGLISTPRRPLPTSGPLPPVPESQQEISLLAHENIRIPSAFLSMRLPAEVHSARESFYTSQENVFPAHPVPSVSREYFRGRTVERRKSRPRRISVPIVIVIPKGELSFDKNNDIDCGRSFRWFPWRNESFLRNKNLILILLT